MRMPLPLLLLGGCCLPDCGVIGTDGRALGVVQIGADEVDVRADLEGERQSVGKTFTTRESWSVRARITVRRGGTAREVVWLSFLEGAPVTPRWTFEDETAARTFFAGLAVTHCTRGPDLVVHVAAPGSPDDRWVLFFLDVGGHVVGTVFRSAAPSCEPATLDAPQLDAFLDRASAEAQPGVCPLLEAISRRQEAMRCVLRSRRAVDPGLEQRLGEAVRGGGEAERDLYAVLDPDSPRDETGWSVAGAEKFLRVAPDAERKRTWIQRTLQRCSRDDASPCAPWRLRVLATAASQLGDDPLCDQVLALGVRLAASPETLEQGRALEGGIWRCGAAARARVLDAAPPR